MSSAAPQSQEAAGSGPVSAKRGAVLVNQEPLPINWQLAASARPVSDLGSVPKLLWFTQGRYKMDDGVAARTISSKVKCPLFAAGACHIGL